LVTLAHYFHNGVDYIISPFKGGKALPTLPNLIEQYSFSG
jgi:hypothetical protein